MANASKKDLTPEEAQSKAIAELQSAPVDYTKMNLEQKLVEIRKAVPTLKKEKHSDKVSYKYAKLDDIWELATPAMNRVGVNFRIVSESDVTCDYVEQKTLNGGRSMWLYKSTLVMEWINADNPEEKITKTLPAIAWNDDPAKAQGAAHTYAVKYDLFMQNSIAMDLDPDNEDFTDKGKNTLDRDKHASSGKYKANVYGQPPQGDKGAMEAQNAPPKAEDKPAANADTKAPTEAEKAQTITIAQANTLIRAAKAKWGDETRKFLPRVINCSDPILIKAVDYDACLRAIQEA